MGILDLFRRAPAPQPPAPRGFVVVDAAPTPRPGRTWSAADGFSNLVAGLGSTSDKSVYGSYFLSAPMAQVDLESIYSSSWLGNRIVSTVAEDMVREWAQVSWDGYDTDVTGSKAITDAVTKWGLRGKTFESCLWARLYGGSTIVVGIRGDDPMKPLDITKIKKGSLQYLHVIDRYRISQSGVLDRDPDSPNFGQPVSFLVADSGVQFHWTRVIRFRGKRLPYRLQQRYSGWDMSVLQTTYPSVKAYDQLNANIDTLSLEGVVDILKLEGMRDQCGSDEGTAALMERISLGVRAKSTVRAWILDKSDEYAQKTVNFSGLGQVLQARTTDVCGAADIPVTRLFGQSPSGLTTTGESDIRNYYNKVGSDQETDLREPLTRAYQIITASTLGRVPENFTLTFNPLWAQSAVEIATVQKTNAERDTILLNAKAISPGLIARQLKEDGVYSTMEEEDVEEIVERDEAAQAATEVALERLAMSGNEPGQPGHEPDASQPNQPPPNDDTMSESDPETVEKPVTDSLPGDCMMYRDGSWYVQSGGHDVAGPFKTHGKAARRLKALAALRR